jgi:hypothetical protein
VSETRREDVAKVLEGFDRGIFVRDVSYDGESGWAVRLLPYLAALGRLRDAVPTEAEAGAAVREAFDRATGSQP